MNVLDFREIRDHKGGSRPPTDRPAVDRCQALRLLVPGVVPLDQGTAALAQLGTFLGPAPQQLAEAPVTASAVGETTIPPPVSASSEKWQDVVMTTGRRHASASRIAMLKPSLKLGRMKVSVVAQPRRARSPETWPTQVTRVDRPSTPTCSRNGKTAPSSLPASST